MKYLLFHDREYLGAINQTLRVVETADGREKTQYALQYLINQYPDNLLILPAGKHKKTDTLKHCIHISFRDVLVV